MVVASPVLTSAVNYTTSIPIPLILMSSPPDVPTYDCKQRSTPDIIWSCIATLILCTWSSVHANMPGPHDEWWRIFWRRVKTMYWALVAPEFVLTWAVRQWIGARNILNEHKELHPSWTKAHAHFLQMGGFHLRHGNKTEVLYPDKFHQLLEEHDIILPSTTENDIKDKSKADALTKTVVLFQSLWFVIQCVEKHIRGLALAQLEVTTLAVISCTFILCIIWWDKPFDAQQPVVLDLALRPDILSVLPAPHKSDDDYSDLTVEHGEKRVKDTKAFTVLQTVITPVTFLCAFVSSVLTAILKEVIAVEGFRWGGKSVLDRTVEICIGWTMINPMMHLAGFDDEAHQESRIGSYFSYSDISGVMLFLPILSAALFGLVHCIAWNSDFPTVIERILWRISTVGVGSLLGIFGLPALVVLYDLNDVSANLMMVISFSAYVLCRYYLLIEAFLSLRTLPLSAFQTIEWSDFLPHI